MNELNNNLLGFLLGIVMFLTIILFMVSLIYFEIIFIMFLKKINSILKRKDKSLDSREEDK